MNNILVISCCLPCHTRILGKPIVNILVQLISFSKLIYTKRGPWLMTNRMYFLLNYFHLYFNWIKAFHNFLKRSLLFFRIKIKTPMSLLCSIWITVHYNTMLVQLKLTVDHTRFVNNLFVTLVCILSFFYQFMKQH